jgi:4-hydroxy-tetrahydrodipicolinate reductase
MSQPLKIGVAGALGRMGRAIIAVAETKPDLALTALFDQPGTEGQSSGAYTLVTADAALAACEAIVDFTPPAAAAALAARVAAEGGPAMIVGGTGATAEEEAAIRTAGSRVALVRTLNFSLGVHILAGLVQQAAARLGAEDWDIEIFEAHHKRKIDAPSGTALMLGEAAARGRQIDLSGASERGRDGITGARKAGAIGFASARGGGIIGEHQVTFASEDEILTFSHSARDRSLFARGALTAALWTRNRPAGIYDMMDVLGFREG